MASRLTDQMVDEILSTAMEGGCNYWTRSVRVIGTVAPETKSTLFPGEEPFTSEMLTKGHDLRWVDDDGEARTLTLAKFRRGIYRAARHFEQDVVEFYETHDATGADVAVQFALLGEIVYG